MSAATSLLYLIVEIAAPLALVVSLTLRWAYLRAVRRSMLRPVMHGAPGGGRFVGSG